MERPGGMVLVVDDYPDAGRMLVRRLNLLGFDAVAVASGPDAFGYLDGHRVALVIVDVMMPGMDGMEVLRRVWAAPRTAAVPVVLFSAEDDPGDPGAGRSPAGRLAGGWA